MTTEMKGKIILVTGANSGIGFYTVIGVAKKGAKVVMVCRDARKGEKARQEAIRISGNSEIELLIADFSSLESVRKVAAEILKIYPRLDVLVNNAGKVFASRQLTADGFEWTFGVNHLAPFLLTNLLLPLLKKSAPSRVVCVASVAHTFGHINFNDLMGEKKYGEMTAYAQSKLANVLFASELSRRLEGTGVTSNSLHPGVVHTDFAREGSGPSRFFYKYFGFILASPEKGARTSVYLATSQEVEHITGGYYSNCRKINPSKEARDNEIAVKLWEISEKLTGLKR